MGFLTKVFASPIFRVISPRSKIPEDNEGFTRRVHRLVSGFILILAFCCGYLQYFGNPIQCWAPSHMTFPMVAYSHSYCYHSNSFKTPTEDDAIPIDDYSRKDSHRNFYKWTPFILAFIAVLYLLPEIVSAFVNKLFVIRFDSILELSRQSVSGSEESKEAAIQQLVLDLESRLDDKVTRAKEANVLRFARQLIPSFSVYIRFQVFLAKLIYALGALVPVIFLSKYLALDFDFYRQVLHQNSSARYEVLFPKTVLCDFRIRQISNVHSYTIMCHVPSNEMFEKISLLVCFISAVVCSVSWSDVVCSVASCLFPPWNYFYVKRHRRLVGDLNGGYDKEMFRDFTETYLTPNVIYFIQLIGQNSSELVACEILARLWEGYRQKVFTDEPEYPIEMSLDSKPHFEESSVFLNDNV